MKAAIAITFIFLVSCASPIDRRKVVERHNVTICATDSLSPAQVGNGHFAFGMDITGLQTFVPFNTLADWSWHSFPKDGAAMSQEYRGVPVEAWGRTVPMEFPDSSRPDISAWLACNPHRFNLGRVGFILMTEDGTAAVEEDLEDAVQNVDLWSGIVTSRFCLEGKPVEVKTACHPDRDAVAVDVSSPLLEDGRLLVFLDFPYADAEYMSAYVGDYGKPELHNSDLVSADDSSALILRRMDAVVYNAALRWEGVRADLSAPGEGSHRFTLRPGPGSRFSFVFEYSPDMTYAPSASEVFASSEESWRDFWLSGAAIDLSGSEDSRWMELEGRIVLSQYLMRMNEAGSWPPQESGLVNNGWYGRFHFEMIFWHELHNLLWNRPGLAEEALGIYGRFLPTSEDRAARYGFDGARWPKCTAAEDVEWPHLIHATLIWQQPHPVYLAETLYRLDPTGETLAEWKDVVFATAEYMADFMQLDTLRGKYVLAPPICPVSENTPIFETRNPTFELSYWRYGLETAQLWRERLGYGRLASWDDILGNMAPLPVQDSLYVTYEGIGDMWSRYNFEHPALAGIYGMLPGIGVDLETFRRTLGKVFEVWDFDRMWGWDFPMLAMAAARCGDPDKAVDMLLHPSPGFRFDSHGLATGGPFPYFPSNGALLAAVAMMAGGWDGSGGRAPGFPENWHVKCEGFNKMQ